MTTCAKCGSDDEFKGPGDCVRETECALRASLRDVTAERDALRGELDTALAAEIKIAGQACGLRAAVLAVAERMKREGEGNMFLDSCSAELCKACGVGT